MDLNKLNTIKFSEPVFWRKGLIKFENDRNMDNKGQFILQSSQFGYRSSLKVPKFNSRSKYCKSVKIRVI